ncbi:phosphatidate cytidylyltransferase [Rubripirellula amarantea]|uniref:Phosphatidate cytidylyltransferase n=1 Tax=Rubripirellula amarantea TaxID=2527999 RepID=A0A5C5WQM9_9BACT|nr:phosphatidate cytidylyltransferase [Rubripirellula amarantea]MDA8744977.1 phosphatidate cytidylyltransferase [Rubripirellula amarantea]TWT52847.1 Phosphatidate cytidylyltransferase [Rubripirellula amarantea]
MMPIAQIQWHDPRTYMLLAVILGTLGIASIVGVVMSRREKIGVESALIQRFNHKLRVWWLMVVIFSLAFFLHRIGVVVLFGMVSFWALREFITMTPTRRGDHRTLFWVFFIFTPLQYVLIALGSDPPARMGGNDGVDYYDYYSIMIPVYASLFIPARAAIAGDYKRFLERSAKIQSGLLICVYSLSYAPAILDLRMKQTGGALWEGSTVSVLIFFVLIAQLASVLERGWGKLAGRHVIAEKINASRTWEGFLGSMVTTGLIASALYWATPFHPWEAGLLGAVVTVMACAGTLTMSAIKRDRGVTDTGTLVQGHAGVLDQIDNVCFAAPVFYHLTRFFWSV